MTLPVATPVVGQEQPLNRTSPPAAVLANVLGSAPTGPGLMVLSYTRQCLFRNAEAVRLMRQLRQFDPPGQTFGDIPSAVLQCCRELENRLERHTDTRRWGQVQLIRVLGRDGNLVLARFHAIPAVSDRAKVSFMIGLLESWVPPAHAAKRAAAPDFQFSEREQACLAHLVQGMTDKEIARQLSISEYTVKDHLKKIRQKTGAINRAGIITRVLGRRRPRRRGNRPAKAGVSPVQSVV